MKKITFCIMAMGLLLTIQPLQSKAEPTITTSSVIISKEENVVNEEEVNALMLRLNEIKDMDRSDLKFKEKKALRKEVRSIENKLQHPGGVYISVGGAILIIFLLIILF